MLNSRYRDAQDRKQVIKKIRDIRNGNSFEYFKQEFYDPNVNLISDDVKRRLLMDSRVLTQVLDFFVSFCPILKPKLVKGSTEELRNKKERLVKKAIKKMNWEHINAQFYDSLETEGDIFIYIYFDNEIDDDGDNIPCITILNSENMKDILISDMSNKAKAYIYTAEDRVETINYETGEVDEDTLGEFVYIFEKGKSWRIGQKEEISESGMLVEEEGELVINSKINKEAYSDVIPIIHISSNKKVNDKFSIIPAEDYVSLCLKIMAMESDIRAVNRMMGFPRITALDCQYIEGDGRIGGIRVAKSIKDIEADDIEARKGQIIEHRSATNKSMFEEESKWRDALYDLVGVTNPTLMKRVGSSDSSKVLQQVNNRMEAKITKYVNNIIDGFKKYFMILFKENEVYEENYDLDYSFDKPRNMIKNSQYDELLQDDLELKTGQSTIEDLLRKKGKSAEEIKEHFKELNFEKLNGNDDISAGEVRDDIKMTVENSNGGIK